MRERRRVTIRGLVQGVYFRETTRRIAAGYDVAGYVRNVGVEYVEIEAEGEAAVVAAFIDHVLGHPPERARIDHVEHVTTSPTGEAGFTVGATSR